jgi:hypothetical protein
LRLAGFRRRMVPGGDHQFAQAVVLPASHRTSRSGPAWSGGDLGNPGDQFRFFTQAGTFRAGVPCIVGWFISTAPKRKRNSSNWRVGAGCGGGRPATGPAPGKEGKTPAYGVVTSRYNSAATIEGKGSRGSRGCDTVALRPFLTDRRAGRALSAANREWELGSTKLSSRKRGEYHSTGPCFAAQHCRPCQNGCLNSALFVVDVVVRKPTILSGAR